MLVDPIETLIQAYRPTGTLFLAPAALFDSGDDFLELGSDLRGQFRCVRSLQGVSQKGQHPFDVFIFGRAARTLNGLF